MKIPKHIKTQAKSFQACMHPYFDLAHNNI